MYHGVGAVIRETAIKLIETNTHNLYIKCTNVFHPRAN